MTKERILAYWLFLKLDRSSPERPGVIERWIEEFDNMGVKGVLPVLLENYAEFAKECEEHLRQHAKNISTSRGWTSFEGDIYNALRKFRGSS